MAMQDVYRQAADRPQYELPRMIFVPQEPPRPKAIVRDDEFAPVIFDEEALARRAIDLNGAPVEQVSPLWTLLCALFGAALIVGMVLITR